MSARVFRYALASAGALIVLTVLEGLLFFVLSGGAQSVRGGFDLGHVQKYLGIWFSVASLTMLIVAVSGVTVLCLAKVARWFFAPAIIGLSVPAGVLAGVTFLGFGDWLALLVPGIWIASALCGVVASMTFCLSAGVPWSQNAASDASAA